MSNISSAVISLVSSSLNRYAGVSSGRGSTSISLVLGCLNLMCRTPLLSAMLMTSWGSVMLAALLIFSSSSLNWILSSDVIAIFFS